LVAVFIFFLANQSLVEFYMAGPACSGVMVSSSCIRRRHTYGAQYDSEYCTGGGEKRAADFNAST
jgi:hypothetical protein